LAQHCCQTVREPIGKRVHFFKFQKPNGANQRILVAGKAAGAIEVKAVVAA
jgi:hypothetical protein